MNRTALIRLAAASIAGALATGLLISLLFMMNAESGFAATTAANEIGWIVPLVAGALAAGLAWALLAPMPFGPSPALPSACRCAACQGIVLGDWRLCPHCGEMLVKDGQTD